jgi:hypothetical protein
VIASNNCGHVVAQPGSVRARLMTAPARQMGSSIQVGAALNSGQGSVVSVALPRLRLVAETSESMLLATETYGALNPTSVPVITDE